MTSLIMAFAVGALHALAPDHWFPFVAIAKAQKWSNRKLSVTVFLAGLAHVLSAFLIGLAGMLLVKISFEQMTVWEKSRADVFSFLLIGFGIAYLIWAVKQWNANRLETDVKAHRISKGFLFVLLILGPCEPLVPFIFLGAQEGLSTILTLFLVFSVATVGTMLVTAYAAVRGLSFIRTPRLQRYSHLIAGFSIVFIGIIVRVLGV